MLSFRRPKLSLSEENFNHPGYIDDYREFDDLFGSSSNFSEERGKEAVDSSTASTTFTKTLGTYQLDTQQWPQLIYTVFRLNSISYDIQTLYDFCMNLCLLVAYRCTFLITSAVVFFCCLLLASIFTY